MITSTPPKQAALYGCMARLLVEGRDPQYFAGGESLHARRLAVRAAQDEAIAQGFGANDIEFADEDLSALTELRRAA